jgi:hypothetical protein
MKLPDRIQAALTLTRFQAIVGVTAGFVSIMVTLYGFLFAARAPTTGEVVAIVQEARMEKPVANAIVEFRTPRDILVTMLLAKDGQARQTLKEGVYRLRVSHPKFTTEVRHIQVLAGHSQEIRVRLAPLAPRPGPAVKTSPLERAGEALKKLFR